MNSGMHDKIQNSLNRRYLPTAEQITFETALLLAGTSTLTSQLFKVL